VLFTRDAPPLGNPTYHGGWDFVAAMALLTVATRISAWLAHRRAQATLSSLYVQLSWPRD